MELGERISTVLKGAGLTPRHLGGATKIHFVTIYRAIDGETSPLPMHQHILTTALDKIESLTNQGRLPLQGKLSRVEKTSRLTDMLSNNS